MTNGAAKVLVLDCVSFEQNVWCSNGMGDKYATKVRWELHLRALFLADTLEWRLDMRSDC